MHKNQEKRDFVRMPGEITPDYICIDGQFFGFPKEYVEKSHLSEREKYRSDEAVLKTAEKESENQRHNFALYYVEGGNCFPYAEFMGEVAEIVKNKILFTRIWMEYEYDDYECDIRKGTEDHVWIYDADPFLKAGAENGKCFKFNACAYAYRRKDGSTDFGLKCPQHVELVPRYELPDINYVNMSETIHEIGDLVCETCIYTEQCYEKGSPVCIAPAGYREDKMRRLFFSNQDNINKTQRLIEREYNVTDSGYLCISMFDLSEENKNHSGIAIDACLPDSGLNPGDILYKINKQEIHTFSDVENAVNGKAPGSQIIIQRKNIKSGKVETINYQMRGKEDAVTFLIRCTPLETLSSLADKYSECSTNVS